MAGRIRVNMDGMQNAASQVDGLIGQWNDGLRNIQQCVRQMDSQWDGLGNNTFANIWMEQKPQFDRLLAMMQEYKQAIITAAQKFSAGEQEISGIVGRR